jgi:WD40 repeat protein
VAFSPDSKLLATGSEDRTIRLWDVASGDRKERIPHDASVWSLAFAPDGKTLAAGDEVGRITLWDVATGEKQSAFKADDKYGISLIAYASDGKTLAVVPYDSYVTHLWDLEKGKVRTTLKGHRGWVATVAFSPDSATVATAANDATIRLWAAKDGKEQDGLRAHDRRIDCLTFLGKDRLLSGGHDGTVIVWDVAGARKGNVVKPVLEAPQSDRDYRKIFNVFVTPRAGSSPSAPTGTSTSGNRPGPAALPPQGDGGPDVVLPHEDDPQPGRQDARRGVRS